MTHCQPSRTRRLLSFCSLLAAAPLAGGLLCQPGHAAEAQAMASPAEASAPAAPQAADHPRLMPARDATIDYVFQPRPPAGGAPVPPPALPVQNRHVQVLFSGDGGLMRINYMIGMDGPESRGAVILNRAAQEVLVILNDRKVYTRLVQQEMARSPFLLDMSMAFTRKGRSTIIGQPCTVWAVHSPRGDGSACVTDDGFILEQDGVDVDGLNGHLKAMKISYDTVPASAFQPPEGFQEVTPHAPGKRGDGEGEAPPPSVMRPGGMPREDHTGAPLASGGMPGVGPVPAIPQAGPAMRDTSDTTP